MKRTALMLFHHCVAHPIAGILWAWGAMDAGDWVHNTTDKF